MEPIHTYVPQKEESNSSSNEQIGTTTLHYQKSGYYYSCDFDKDSNVSDDELDTIIAKEIKYEGDV